GIPDLIVHLELEYDTPVTDHCGSRTACLRACPTQAILEPYKVDGSKCIAYITLGVTEDLPHHGSDKFNDWISLCDTCQDVCPWNKFSKSHNEPLFDPHPELLDFERKDWEDITRETFNEIFKRSAVKRTKFEGLKRNIQYLKA